MSTATAGAAAPAHRTSAYAWVVLAMLAFIYIFNFLDRQLMSTLIESIRKDPAFITEASPNGLTDKQMGFMTGFNFALFYTVFGVIVGFLADRTSRRNILFAGAFLWSAFTALCGMAQTYPVMLAARAGVGVGEAAGAPPSYSIISDYFPPEKRGLALALFSLGVPLGQAFAVAFGAQIDLHFGWRNAFIGIGVAGIIAAIMLLFVVREPKRGAMDHSATVTPEQAHALASEKSGFITTLWAFLSRPMLLWTALACGFTAFVGYASLVWNSPFFLRVLGMTLGELSIWYALAIGLGIGLGTWASGALTDWLVKRSKAWFALMPAIAMAAAAPFWYFYTRQSEWGMALVILIAPLFLTIMYLAPALALVQNSVKPSQRTMSGATLLMILNMIGLGGGPTLVGMLSTNFTNANVAAGMETAAAGVEGLREAMAWMTPFYAVAVAFLILEMITINRETRAGKAIGDGGLRAGLVLSVVGITSLYFRFEDVGLPNAVLNMDRISAFGGAALVDQIDTSFDIFVSLASTVFAVWGVWLLLSAAMRVASGNLDEHEPIADLLAIGVLGLIAAVSGRMLIDLSEPVSYVLMAHSGLAIVFGLAIGFQKANKKKAAAA
jgi:predicted MFS family arabinose efflux permease